MQPDTSPEPPSVPSRAAAALERLRRQLTARLAKPDALATFGEAQLRHPEALSPYATPMAAVEHVLALTAGRDNEEVKVANSILRAMVLEYQATPRDTWAAALILTVGPAMRRLAFLARPRRLDPDDLVHQMVESLLVMAMAHPAVAEDTYLPVYLKREMSRHAFEEWEHGRKDKSRTHAAVTDALERGRIEPFADGRDELTSDPVEDMVARETLGLVLHALGPLAVGAFMLDIPSLRNFTRLARSDLSGAKQESLYQLLKRWYARCRAKGLCLDELPPGWLALRRSGPKRRKKS